VSTPIVSTTPYINRFVKLAFIFLFSLVRPVFIAPCLGRAYAQHGDRDDKSQGRHCDVSWAGLGKYLNFLGFRMRKNALENM